MHRLLESSSAAAVRVVRAFILALAMPCALAMLFLGSAASAQSNPLSPDPVTTPELMKYADMIGLSDQQKLSLITAHDSYKMRYRAFQERDVRKFLDDLIDIGMRFQRNRFQIPPRDELEGIIDQFKRLMNSTHALDRSLFDEVASSLTEDQLLKLPRARTARDLSIYRELVMEFAGEFNPGARVDFAEIMRGASFPPEAVQAADPIIAEYQSSMLSRARGIYEAIADASKVILDLIDELGIRDMTPDKMMAMAQDQNVMLKLQGTFDEASKPFQAAAFELSQLNYRTFKRLAATLPPQQARYLRERYYDIAFDDAYQGRAEWEQRYADALVLPSVAEQQKQDIQAQQEAFQFREDGMIDGVVADMEAAREYRSFQQLSERSNDPIRKRIEELRERRASLNAEAISTLEAILGPEFVAAAQQEKLARKQAAEAAAQNATALALPAAASEQKAIEPANDPYFPPPMSLEEFNRICAALAMSEGDRSVASTLYDEYRAQFENLKAAPLDVAVDVEPTSTEYGKAQQTRFDQLAALDKSLFDDLQMLAAADHQVTIVGWASRVRSRGVANSTALALGGTWAESEASTDPVAMLLGVGIEAAHVPSLARAISDHEAQIEPHLAGRLDASRQANRRMAQWRKAGQLGADSAKAVEFARDKYTEAQREMRRASRKIMELNRQLVDQLCQALSESHSWQLRQAYNRAAYPDIYDDGRSAQNAVKAVLNLNELSETQRQTINEINDSYRADYYALCERMTEVRRAIAGRDDRNDMPSREDINRWMESERLSFERKELNARTRMRLSLVIGNDLAQRIAELKEES